MAHEDQAAELCELYRDFPDEERSHLLEMGRDSAGYAANVAFTIQDLPCMAFYLSILAQGLMNAGDNAAAREPISRSVDLYRQLSREYPADYLSHLARMLSNQGIVLSDLNCPVEALAVYLESLTLRRQLAEEDPGRFRSQVAASLTNLGVTHRELQEFDEARVAHEEAAQIYCELAETEPQTYGLYWATALNNLGGTLRDLRQLAAAQAAFDKALAIRRGLAEPDKRSPDPDLAILLTNMGNLFDDRRELGAARRAHDEALTIRRQLAKNQPEVFLPAVAQTLVNLATTLHNMREPTAARAANEEAISILRRLPPVHLPALAAALMNLGAVFDRLRDLHGALAAYDEALSILRGLGSDRVRIAKVLNNLGITRRGLGDLEAAREAIDQALGIYLDLAEAKPDIYRPDVAQTLNNLGPTLDDLKEREAARFVYQDAARIYRELDMWVEAASPIANLGIAEKEHGNREEARKYFEESLEYLNLGLKKLETAEHHDKFKAVFDSVASALIGIYAEAGPEDMPGANVAGLLESLRRHDILGDGTESQRLLSEIEKGTGRITDELVRLGAVMMYIHAADETIVFGILRPGRALSLHTAPKLWYLRFHALNELIRTMTRSGELSHFAKYPERYRGGPADRRIRRLMQEAFRLLPAVDPSFCSPAESRWISLLSCCSRQEKTGRTYGWVFEAGSRAFTA